MTNISNRELAAFLLGDPSQAKSRRQMQQRALSGREPTAEQMASYLMGSDEREQRQSNLGALGLELTGVPQVARAGSAAYDLYQEPSYANAINAGANSALAIFRPLMAAKIAGGGVLGAYATDAARVSKAGAASPAEAEKRLRAMSPNQIKTLQQEVGINPDGRIGTNTIEAYARKLTEAEAEAKARQEREARAAEAGAVAEAQARATATAGLTSEREARVAAAKEQLLKELAQARQPVKDDSLAGQTLERLGPMAPFLLGVAGGTVAKAGINATGGFTAATKYLPERMRGPAQVATKVVDDYAVPAVAGMEFGVGAGMAPLSALATRGDPTNPEYAAWQRYRHSLPAEATEEIGRADTKIEGIPGKVEGIPKIDPLVTDARRATSGLSPERMSVMLQSAAGGSFGSLLANAAPYVARGAGTMVRDAAEGAVETIGGLPARLIAGHRAARNGTNGLGTGNANPGGNPAAPFGDWAAYPPMGSPQREAIREAYRDATLASGGPFNPSVANRVIQGEVSASGGSLPNVTRRVKGTNQNYDEFVATHGRPPISKQEWDNHIFKATGTLGLAGAAAALSADQELERILSGAAY